MLNLNILIIIIFITIIIINEILFQKTLNDNKDKIYDVFKVNKYGKIEPFNSIQLYLYYNELIERTKDKEYFYREKKPNYYKLYFDIDYPYNTNFISNHDDYTNKIINVIIIILNKVFINPDITYIYAKKINNDNNVHLYFYNLIVTQEIHTYLLNEIYSYFINIEKVLLEHIIMIVDYRVICNMTLRLFYFNFRNSYYYPSIEKSTYKLPTPITDTFGNNDSKIATYDNIKKYLIYSIITTDKKVHEPLSPYYDIIKNKKILFNCKIIHP